jgi:hypothetical protein
MTRIANPRAREIHYGEIFAADGTGTPEEAAKDFREGLEADFASGVSYVSPPKVGAIISMRDFDQNFQSQDWYDVVVS